MNEVKKVILFLLCCAIPFSFYAQKARQNAATKKWGYEQTENKGWWENSKYRGNSMFGEWDAALVNQDYEINWLISPQYEEVTNLNLITLIILEITCWLQSSKMVSSGLLI